MAQETASQLKFEDPDNIKLDFIQLKYNIDGKSLCKCLFWLGLQAMLIHNTSKVGDILKIKLAASSWKLRNTFIEAAVKTEKFTVEDLLTAAMKDDIVRNNPEF